jgi:hypothetical protein
MSTDSLGLDSPSIHPGHQTEMQNNTRTFSQAGKKFRFASHQEVCACHGDQPRLCAIRKCTVSGPERQQTHRRRCRDCLSLARKWIVSKLDSSRRSYSAWLGYPSCIFVKSIQPADCGNSVAQRRKVGYSGADFYGAGSTRGIQNVRAASQDQFSNATDGDTVYWRMVDTEMLEVVLATAHEPQSFAVASERIGAAHRCLLEYRPLFRRIHALMRFGFTLSKLLMQSISNEIAERFCVM